MSRVRVGMRKDRQGNLRQIMADPRCPTCWGRGRVKVRREDVDTGTTATLAELCYCVRFADNMIVEMEKDHNADE